MLMDGPALPELLAAEAELRYRFQGFAESSDRSRKVIWLAHIADIVAKDLLDVGTQILAKMEDDQACAIP